MKNKLINILKKIKNSLRNFMWVFSVLLAFQSISYKIPYGIVIGAMLLLNSFIFLPWQDKIFFKFKIKLSMLNKFFIIFMNLNICALSIKINETSYYKCILPIILMLLMWILLIMYLKIKIDNKEHKKG